MKKILIFTIIIFVSISKINAISENKILPILEGEEKKVITAYKKRCHCQCW